MKLLHPILYWHPILIGVWVGVGLMGVGLFGVIRSVNRSGVVHREIAAAEASLAAEEAAFAFAHQSHPTAGSTYQTASGFSCELTTAPSSSGSVMTILVLDRFGTEHRFGCDLLAGATPRVFGQPFSILLRGTPERTEALLSIARTPPEGLAQDQWPRLDRAVGELPAQGWRRTGVLRRDSSLALLRLPSGTDRTDYVLADREGAGVSPSVPPSGVVRLDGHLWVDRADKPVLMHLDRDLTIVIRGNLYLGRSVHVRGPGRLVLVVTRRRDDMFRDLDLDGRWSDGDELLTSGAEFSGGIEGSGSVYLGLPAGNPVPDSIRLDAALVVDGEVHIQSSRAEVWGALAVGHGVTGAGEDHVLLTLGLLLPDTQRERIPGFQPVGRPRPGILRRL